MWVRYECSETRTLFVSNHSYSWVIYSIRTHFHFIADMRLQLLSSELSIDHGNQFYSGTSGSRIIAHIPYIGIVENRSGSSPRSILLQKVLDKIQWMFKCRVGKPNIEKKTSWEMAFDAGCILCSHTYRDSETLSRSIFYSSYIFKSFFFFYFYSFLRWVPFEIWNQKKTMHYSMLLEPHLFICIILYAWYNCFTPKKFQVSNISFEWAILFKPSMFHMHLIWNICIRTFVIGTK